ncbi:MAG TPA: tetratricopeptide repeat protein, partial [Myxococcales bacterium]|nr:tetratricopeptide repeat protein [Myxococcales bacterium]
GDLPSPISQAPLSKSPFDFTGPDEQTSTDAPQPTGTATSLDFGTDPGPPPPQDSAAKDDLLDFGELPSPADPGDLPTPAEPPSDADLNFDFSPPPPPARMPDPELDQEPASAAPSSGFGEVDFTSPATTQPSMVDPLEFDPTSKSSPAAPRDELEADLSAPIPPPASTGPADGLEMLNFIDDAARQQGSSPLASRSPPRISRWHVRRRSGKVFGPFDEGVVIKMLEDGQLLGNEDISGDGDSWAPMSSAPTLSAAIQRLMNSPSRGHGSSSGSFGGSTARPSGGGPQAASMDRLKSLYEGRMAAVAVVDGRQSNADFRRRLPLLVVLGVVAVLALAGASLTVTRYGAFGMRLLFPAKLPPSSPQYQQYLEAKRALLQDTFKSYRESRDLTARILATTEYPEVRATWCQAVFYLQRRYAAATPQERLDAAAALPRVELLGMKNAEVVKAFAGYALASRSPAEALPILLEAKARAANESDRELDMLLAEAYASKGDARSAEEVLQRVLKVEAGSAKALHALGNLKQSANQADEAAKAYAAALEADPNHAISAVELSAVDLLVRHNDAEGLRAVEKALSPQSESLLGPAEMSRAKALRGVALAAQFKSKEATDELDQALKLDPDSVFAKAMLARVLLGQREFKRALPLFKEATTRDPANLEYAEGYLQALVATGNMSEAIAEVARVNQRFPGNARIAFLYGRISDALDNAADAETHYKRAIKADPRLYQANLALARFYLRMRRVADAKPQLEAAQQAQGAGGDAAVHSGLGELAFTEGNLVEARKELESAAKMDPTLAEAHLGLSKVELAESRFEESLALAEKALKLDEHIKDGRLHRALALWKLQRLDDSIEELGKAKLEDPKSARVMMTTGAVHLDRSNLPAAEAALLSALTLESTNHEAHFYMARVKAKRYEFAQAIESMKNALERAPKRPAYHYELGLIYRDAKRLNDAIESWNTAVKLDARHADALEALGQAYLDRGELERAVESFDASLKADPARTRILGLVGDCYFQAAKWNEAIVRYQEALKVDSKLVQVYYKLGRAYSEKADHARSISYYQKATLLDKDNAMPYYYLGYAYKERGKKREAVAAFRDYLKRRPDAEDKKEIEDEIYDLEQDYQ